MSNAKLAPPPPPAAVPAAAHVGENTDGISSPASATESDVQWEELSDESTREAGGDPEIEEPLAAPAAAPSGEGAPPVEPPPLATPPAELPAPVEGELQAPAAGTPPVETPSSQLTTEQIAENQRKFNEWTAAEEAKLTEHYTLTEDDAVAMATEPERVLPKLAAKLHMQVLQEARAQIMNMIPQVVKGVQMRETLETKAQGEFFGSWPELKGKESEVVQMGLMFRQLNPKATPEEAIARIGEMTMNALGIKRVSNAEPPGTPSAGGSNVRAFKPAGGGSSSAGAKSKQEANPFSDLLDDD